MFIHSLFVHSQPHSGTLLASKCEANDDGLEIQAESIKYSYILSYIQLHHTATFCIEKALTRALQLSTSGKSYTAMSGIQLLNISKVKRNIIFNQNFFNKKLSKQLTFI